MENNNQLEKLTADVNPDILVTNTSEAGKVQVYVDNELKEVPESNICNSILDCKDLTYSSSKSEIVVPRNNKSNQINSAIEINRICHNIVESSKYKNMPRSELQKLALKKITEAGNLYNKSEDIISEYFDNYELRKSNKTLIDKNDVKNRNHYISKLIDNDCIINSPEKLDNLINDLVDENNNLRDPSTVSIFNSIYYDSVDKSLYILCNCGKFTRMSKKFAFIQPNRQFKVTILPIPCIHSPFSNRKVNVAGQGLINVLHTALTNQNPDAQPKGNSFAVSTLSYDNIYSIIKDNTLDNNIKKYFLDFREYGSSENELLLKEASMDSSDSEEIYLYDEDQNNYFSSSELDIEIEESVAVSLEDEDNEYENIDPNNLYYDYLNLINIYSKEITNTEQKPNNSKNTLKTLSNFFASIYSDYDLIKRKSIETIIVFLESCDMVNIFSDSYIQYPVIEYYRNHLDDNCYYIDFLKNYFSFKTAEETLEYCDYFLDYSKNNKVQENLNKITRLKEIISLLKIKDVDMSNTKYNKYVKDKKLFKIFDEISDRMITYNLGIRYLDGLLNSSKPMKKLKNSLELSREYEDLIRAFKEFLGSSDFNFNVSEKCLIKTFNFVNVFSNSNFNDEVEDSKSFFYDIKDLITNKDKFTGKCLKLLKNSFCKEYDISILYVDILNNIIDTGNLESISKLSGLSGGLIKSFSNELNIVFDEEYDLCLLDILVLNNKFFFEEFNIISCENENIPVLERLKKALVSCNLLIEDVIEEVKDIPLLPEVLDKYKDFL